MSLEKLDPLIVVSIAAVIIVVIVFNFLSAGKKPREEEKPRATYKSTTVTESVSTSSTATTAPAAKKKKSRSKPKSSKAKKIVHENKYESLATSSAAEGDDDESDDEDFSDAVIPSKQAQALLKKSKADAKAAATEAKANPEVQEKKAEEKAKKAEAKKAAATKKAAKKVTVVTTVIEKQEEVKVEVPVVSPAPEPVQPKVETDSNDHLEVTPAAVPYDGWAVVEDKRKSKPKTEEGAPVVEETVEEVVPEVPAPVVEIFTEDFEVDAKKLGLLIGPKGVTKIGIQNATGATINMPKTEKDTTGSVTISVSGPDRNGVKKAVHALNELVTKGYATLLAAEDFQESYVAVHYKFLPDIIGKGGSVIRALNAHTGVKITVPQTSKTPGPDGRIPKVKIGLAGPKEKVSLTRALIKDLTKFYVTPVTHPDQTYIEMDIDKKYYNFIIGSKGSEIKHIQNNYKVQVHIPDEDSVNPNIVIVGTEDNTQQAKKHIEKIIERVDTAAAAKAAAEAAGTTTVKRKDENSSAVANGAVDGTQKTDMAAKPVVPAPPGMTQLGGGANNSKAWGAADHKNNNRIPVATPNADEEEAWTREFLPPSSIPMDIASMLPPGAKYSSAPTAPIGTKLTPDTNPTPSGLPIEPKQPPASSPWNNIPGQW